MPIKTNNWQDLIKPKSLDTNPGSDPNYLATFVAQPLERGFGQTLGNALRTILLSSLQGTAITSIKIENVLHEFSSLAGVREGVSDIILHVQQIALRMQCEGPKRIRLSVSGPAKVTAGDIALPEDIEVINKDLVICHLDKGASLNMELTADTGRGYVPAINSRPVDAPIGLIPVDAFYSPVRQVSYRVEKIRIGEGLLYDKLSLSVETNGTVTPQDALSYAARIFQDQLSVFVEMENADRGESDADQPNRYLDDTIDTLELSVRSASCLEKENIIYIGDLVQKTEAEMLRIANFGRKSLSEIKQVLSTMGLRLGMDIAGWPASNIQKINQTSQKRAKEYAEAESTFDSIAESSSRSTTRVPLTPNKPPGDDNGLDALAPAVARSDRRQSISFFFATSRRRDKSAELEFGHERANELSLGVAQVHVPDERLFGSKGRPWECPIEIPLVSLSFLNEAENPRVHFVIERTQVLDLDSWKDMIGRFESNEALIFVHGFKTSFSGSIYRAAQIFWDLQYEGTPVLFSWASAGKLRGYGYDLDSASLGAEHFLQLLEHLKESGISRVHILAHSMGNHLVLSALYDLVGRNRQHSISELIMAAPDVDRDLYLQKVGRLTSVIPGLTLYASSKDKALAFSKTLRRDIPRAGDVLPTGPILAPGVDTIDVTALGDELFGSNHGVFASTRSVLNDIGLLIGFGTRPPNKRLVELRGMPVGEYPARWWQFAR